jgi:homoprotocatechuate degradation regulator HpaR
MKTKPIAGRALPMRDFSRSLPMALLRAREAVMRRFRPALRDRQVTEQQWRILRALAHLGPTEVTALAKTTFLRAPSLLRILPDLEARHLISRQKLESDRRRAVVKLEREGLRLIAAHAPDSEAQYERIARDIGAERVELLFELLRDLERRLAESDQSVSAPLRSRHGARRRVAP